MNIQEVIEKIKDQSTCINQLYYNKNTKTSYELRVKNGNTFVFIQYGGENGFSIFFEERDLDAVLQTFEKL